MTPMATCLKTDGIRGMAGAVGDPLSGETWVGDPSDFLSQWEATRRGRKWVAGGRLHGAAHSQRQTGETVEDDPDDDVSQKRRHQGGRMLCARGRGVVILQGCRVRSATAQGGPLRARVALEPKKKKGFALRGWAREPVDAPG